MRTMVIAAIVAGITAGRGQVPDLANHTIVDLTHSYGASTVFWPTAETKFTLQKLAHGQTPGGYFYAANAFCTPEHGGTHLDAPNHFSEAGRDRKSVG